MPDNSALSYLEPLDDRSRGSAVLEALAEMVERAGLGIGDRLPPELALAQQLGVGRSTIREALNKWEGVGLIRRKRGVGTYLTARLPKATGPVPVMVQLEGEGLLRLIEVRRALEIEVVRLATERASGTQRAEIDRLCDELLAVIAAQGDYRAPDQAFHAAIYDASGNSFFAQILVRLDEAFEKSSESPFSRNAFGLDSFPLHRDLADGILDRDATKAVAAINDILDIVEREVRRIIDAGVRQS